MQLKFTIPGVPGKKARHRDSYIPGKGGKKGFIRQYNPEENDRYENLIKIAFQNQYPNFTPLKDIPVQLLAIAYYPFKKSFTKKEYNEALGGRKPKITKPDFDNVSKIIGDALNGIAWKDDGIIYDGRLIKYYGEVPRIDVNIYY